MLAHSVRGRKQIFIVNTGPNGIKIRLGTFQNVNPLPYIIASINVKINVPK